jgi:hypothetical protein
MAKNRLSKAASLMGKRSYQVRLQRFGLKRLQEIARANGKQHGPLVGKGGSK